MLDYYSKAQGLTEEQLLNEMESINKRLMRGPSHAIEEQLLAMLATLETAYHDTLETARLKNSKDEVLNIGEIEVVEYTPDYSESEMLVHVVNQYIDPTEKKK